jgi:hypothetical protein
MIRHIVLIRFKVSVTADERARLFAELSGLKPLIAGTRDFFAGQNISPETPVTHGFNDGFWFDFENSEVRDAYLIDPRHQAIGAKLVSAAEGGLEGIQVFDIAL